VVEEEVEIHEPQKTAVDEDDDVSTTRSPSPHPQSHTYRYGFRIDSPKPYRKYESFSSLRGRKDNGVGYVDSRGRNRSTSSTSGTESDAGRRIFNGGGVRNYNGQQDENFPVWLVITNVESKDDVYRVKNMLLSHLKEVVEVSLLS
jgi:hypothetical protein